MREFSVTAYRWLAERVEVPLLVGETSDGSHLNTADFIASGCATYVRTSANHRGGMTGAMRIAHLADSFRLRAEVHGPTEPAVHLCMAIPNCTYYESLVTSNPVAREPRVGPDGLVHAPTDPGIALAGLRPRAPRSRDTTLNDMDNSMKGAHMKVKRRWLVLASLVAVAATAAALVAASTGGASSGRRVRLDHRLGRRRPPAGGEAVREDAPERAREHRHLRRRRQRRDDDADEDPAVEPHGQRLAGRRLQRAGERPGLDGPEAVRLRPEPEGRLPEDAPQGLARAVARAVHGQRPPRLPPGQPRPGGALRQQEADGASSATRCRRRGSSGRRSAQKVAKEHPGYIIGNIGDSYGHWLYLWADKCPISQVVAPKTVRINSATCTARAWRSLLDPLIKSGVVPPESVFTADFATEVRRRHRQDPAHAGADVVREGHLRRHAEGPGRRDDGRDAAALEQRAAHRPARSAAARGSSRSTRRTWRLPSTS